MPGVFLGHGMAGTGTVAGGLHKLGKMLLEILLEQFHGLSKVTNKNLYKCSRTCGVNRLVVRGGGGGGGIYIQPHAWAPTQRRGL